MRPICSWLALGVLSLSGCGTFVDFTPINESPHQLKRRRPATVAVFSSGPPTRPHVDVALVEVEQTHGLNEQGTGLMIRHLLAQAAEIGCDGIVLGGATDHQGAQPGSGWDLLDPGSTKRQATCIVYDDPEPVGAFKTAPSTTVVPSPSEGTNR